MLTANAGPIVVFSRQQAPGPGYTPDYNADAGPSVIAEGFGLLDPRFGYRNGAAATEIAAFLFVSDSSSILLNQVPSTIATNNIAAVQHTTNATPLTLVSTTGAGITVLAAALTILQSGQVVPSGSLAIDTAPVVLTFGQNGAIATMDPRNAIARAVSITGVASGTGGHFLVSGADLYGLPQTENINATAGATTTNGKKAFKFIYSVTPLFTDAHNYAVGTTDIFGFPLRVDEFQFTNLMWNGSWITANTGFTAADATTPATATTGDPRGTYAAQSASDGTKKLAATVSIPPWNFPSVLGNNTGVFGVTPA